MLARSAGRASDPTGVGRSPGEALALAESLGLDELCAVALVSRGAARIELDQEEMGFADLERSIRIAGAIGSAEAIRGNISLSHHLRHHGEFTRSVAVFEEAVRLSELHGNTPQRRMLAGMSPSSASGRVAGTRPSRLAAAYLDEVQGVHYHTWHALQTRGLIRLLRGDDAGIDDSAASSEAARSSVDLSVLSSALGIYARSLVLVGRLDEAGAALDESLAIFDSLEGRSGFDLPYLVVAASSWEWTRARPHVARLAHGRTRRSRTSLVTSSERQTSTRRSARCPTRPRRGYAPGGAARSGGARKPKSSSKALAFYRRVGAVRFVREGEAAPAAGLQVPA